MIYTKEQLEAMSECEINAIVFIIHNCNEMAYISNGKIINPAPDGKSCKIIDYCNNPNDTMPLVFDVKINLLVTHCGWMAFSEHDKPFESEDANPLRAYAIVYILVKQGE